MLHVTKILPFIFSLLSVVKQDLASGRSRSTIIPFILKKAVCKQTVA